MEAIPNYKIFIDFAENALKVLSKNKTAYERYPQYMEAVKRGATHVGNRKDDEYGLVDSEIVFIAAVARDIVDNIMADLFRLDMLKGEEKLVAEYHSLPSREAVSADAKKVQEEHNAEEKAADEEYAKRMKERRERNTQFTLFQQLCLNKISDIKAARAEVEKKIEEDRKKYANIGA